MMDIDKLKNKSKPELISIIQQLSIENDSLGYEKKINHAKSLALAKLIATSSLRDYLLDLIDGITIKPTSSLRMVVEGNGLFGKKITAGVGPDHEDFLYLDFQVDEQLGGTSSLEIGDTSKIHNLIFESGKPYPRSLYAFPIVLADLKVGYIWIGDTNIHAYQAQDLSQIKRMVDELEWALAFYSHFVCVEQAKEIYLAALDDSTDPIVLCDVSGSIILSNKAARDVFLINCDKVVNNEAAPEVLEPLKKVPDSLVVFVDNQEYSAKRNEIKSVQSGDHFIYHFRNITRERSRERYFSAIIEALSIQIDKELETIKGFAVLTSSLGDLTEKQKTYLEKIEESINHLDSQTSDLFSLNRLNPDGFIKLSEVDLPELIDKVAGQFQPIFSQKQLKLEKELSKSFWKITTDYGLIEQILLNLFESASQDAKMGGDIVVALDVLPSSTSIHISDNGAGLSRPDIEAIMENHPRIAESQKNLYNARVLTNLILGKMEIKSELGEGKKVKITLEQNH